MELRAAAAMGIALLCAESILVSYFCAWDETRPFWVSPFWIEAHLRSLKSSPKHGLRMTLFPYEHAQAYEQYVESGVSVPHFH